MHEDEKREEALLKLIGSGAGIDYARQEIRRILAPQPPENQPIREIKNFLYTRTYDPEYDRKRTDIMLRIYQGYEGEPQFEIAHQGFATHYPNYCKMYPGKIIKPFWELTKAAIRLFRWILMMSWDEVRVMDEFRAHYLIRIQEIKDLKTLPLGRTKES